MRFDCPNDGPFDVEPEEREKQAVRVEQGQVVPTDTPRSVVVVGVCPTCGSPIVEG